MVKRYEDTIDYQGKRLHKAWDQVIIHFMRDWYIIALLDWLAKKLKGLERKDITEKVDG